MALIDRLYHAHGKKYCYGNASRYELAKDKRFARTKAGDAALLVAVQILFLFTGPLAPFSTSCLMEHFWTDSLLAYCRAQATDCRTYARVFAARERQQRRRIKWLLLAGLLTLGTHLFWQPGGLYATAALLVAGLLLALALVTDYPGQLAHSKLAQLTYLRLAGAFDQVSAGGYYRSADRTQAFEQACFRFRHQAARDVRHDVRAWELQAAAPGPPSEY